MKIGYKFKYGRFLKDYKIRVYKTIRKKKNGTRLVLYHLIQDCRDHGVGSRKWLKLPFRPTTERSLILNIYSLIKISPTFEERAKEFFAESYEDFLSLDISWGLDHDDLIKLIKDQEKSENLELKDVDDEEFSL